MLVKGATGLNDLAQQPVKNSFQVFSSSLIYQIYLIFNGLIKTGVFVD